MSPENSGCPLAHSDAAYVLGALSPADRLDFERHLPGCERCRRSVAELAGLPGLLGRVPREQVEAPLPFEPLPETVLPALVAAVRRDQRRKAVWATLGAAAAVAVVALGATALQAARDDGPVPQAQPTSSSPTVAPALPMDVVVDYGASADVSLTQTKSGTRISWSCHYADRGSDYSGHSYRYDLVAITDTGETEPVGSWWAEAGETNTGYNTIAVELDHISKVELRNYRGKAILRLKL
jgi:Putative zinc-finger